MIEKVIRNLMGHVWLIIIAGGRGTRLFPISNPECGKQFCLLGDEYTFLQSTIRNFTSIGFDNSHVIVVVSDKKQAAFATTQATEVGIPSENIWIGSSDGYAGAMIEASRRLVKIDEHAIVINTPADHYLDPTETFQQILADAIAGALHGFMVLIGNKITDLSTAMGCGHAIYEETDQKWYPVNSFIEKPDEECAKKLLQSDNSTCNTGIMVWHAQDISNLAPKRTSGFGTAKLMKVLGNRLKVVVGKFPWRDCGTLKGLYSVPIIRKSPHSKNATLGNGEFHLSYSCKNSLFYADEGLSLRVSNAVELAVVFNHIKTKPTLLISRLDESREIARLFEDYEKYDQLLSKDFSFNARNNHVTVVDSIGGLSVVFVGVNQSDVTIYHREEDGILEALVSINPAFRLTA